MGKGKFLGRFVVPALFFGNFLFFACSDEFEQIEYSNHILFTPEIGNTWTHLETKSGGGEYRSSVSALQAEGTGSLYLHTLYADSIEPPVTKEANDSVAVTRAAPVSAGNMYNAFGVSAYAYIGAWDNTQLPNYMYDVTVGKSGSSWEPSSAHYWPGSAYKMKFFAYAPKGNDAYRLSGRDEAGSPTITCAIPAGVSDQQDLLVAASGEVSGHSATAVRLTFRHALTAVKFVCGSDMKAGTIKSVTLKGVNSAGSYNFGTQAWSGIGTVKDFSQTLDKATDGTAGGAVTTEAQTFMMLPQTLPSGARIEIVFNDGTGDRTLTGNIAGQVWPVGKTVTYKISTASINWTYVLTVNPPADFAYTGGTNTYRVTSYRHNGRGEKEPVEWKAQFSTDGGRTWSDTRPGWLTAFTASGAGGTNPATFNATVVAQTGTTDSPHTSALRQRPVKGTATAPYNLSNGNGGSAVENTANCYVVDAPGYYSFPLVYGNAIKNRVWNRSAYHTDVTVDGVLKDFINHLGNAITDPHIAYNAGCTPAKAELVWQDALSLVSEIRYNKSGAGNISFKVDKSTIRQGNAVIAVKDASGTVLWSWHIWVTDENIKSTVEVTNYQNVKYRFMPVNLGWCDGEIVTYDSRSCKVRFTAGGQTSEITVSQKAKVIKTGGNCPYYQWGRKDPLRPSDGLSHDKIWYDANGESSNLRVTTEAFPYGSECIKNYIRKPDVMQSRGQYYGDNAYLNLWSTNNNTTSSNNNPVVKTIYDPCPVGFKLPASKAFTGFTTTGRYTDKSYEVNGIWDDTRKGWNFYTRANKTGQQIFFPASGQRYYSSGFVSYVDEVGDYQSAGASKPGESYFLVFGSSTVSPDNEGYRTVGCAVRPAQE